MERPEQIRANNYKAVKLVFFFVFVVLFFIDLLLVVTGRSQEFDKALLGTIFDLRGDLLNMFFRAVTFCGNTNTMLGLCIFIIIMPGRMKIGLPVSIMTGVGSAAHSALKHLVARPRPDMENWLVNETGYSFPSGHANASMIFWVALLILLGRVLILRDKRLAAEVIRVVFFILAVLIGVSRPYLGVHYPSDVFGGWMLAGTLLILFFAFYDNIWPYKWRVTYDIPLHNR